MTLADKSGEVPELDKLGPMMELLKESISNSLRRGDLFTQYSTAQYILMLLDTSQENARMIGRRVAKSYSEHCNGDDEVRLHVDLRPMDNRVGQ